MPTLLLSLIGCGYDGCLDGGEEGCRIEVPCASLSFECSGSTASVSQVQPGGVELEGSMVLQAPGDWVLRNDSVYIVISALDHPHYLAPTGGNILDAATIAPDGSLRSDDNVRNVFQVGGLLPEEAASYQKIEAFMDGENAVVQVIGTYDDDPDVRIATRYELGPCDPGVRIRTEVLNKHHEPESVFLADTLYLGGREGLGFAPGPDLGLAHKSFGLTSLTDGIVEAPFIASGAHEEPASSEVFVACDRESVSGILSEELLAVGNAPRLLQSGDMLTYERFFGVGPGSSIAAAADIAFEVRQQLFNEESTVVTGRITTPGDPNADYREGRPQLLISEGDTPWTHVEPAADGSFSFRVPAGGSYTAQVERFGLPWGSVDFSADGSALEVPMNPPGRVNLDVTVNGVADHALVTVHPADEATHEAVRAEYLGHYQSCAPMIGNPYGRDPSCNRVLVNGPRTVALPPGNYDFYAVGGPFTSLGVARGVAVNGVDPVPVNLAIETLNVLDAGMLTGDFHAHGATSFDAQVPDDTRVRAFLAGRVDVIAATDHDAVHDYADARAALNADEKLQVLVGLETTGHILQPLLESSTFPKVVGHWIVWPLEQDPEGPWRGAPWDEKAMPGELFGRFEDFGWPADSGVIQLNHPWGGSQFGRDFGWATALEMDPSKPLEGPDVPEGHDLWSHTHDGARFANDDFHVQEVMNGTDNGLFLQYRALWHYMLSEGAVRGGTANSDSHSLGGNVIGFPVNVVQSDTVVGPTFDEPAFNGSVRAGRMTGTNGPVIVARVVDGETSHEPRIDAAIPRAGRLVVDLRAADWVPIEEVRIYVDGALVETFDPQLSTDAERSGVRSARFERELSSLVAEGGDHWVVVEAGAPLVAFADFDCDRIPDTDDNNGDGVVDAADIEVEEGAERPQPDENGCYSTVGPLDGVIDKLALPTDDFSAVVAGGYPLAFTNPFLVDGDGNGAYDGVTR